MDRFMKTAIQEAKKSLSCGGIPIGSVLVKNGKIISVGHNQRIQKKSQILHAEIDCIENAGRQKTYKGCTLYSTLMPCFLCAGAIVQFGIKKVVAGESKTFSGAKRFMKAHGVRVIDLDSDECKAMMKEFTQKNPKLWNEDIGKE